MLPADVGPGEVIERVDEEQAHRARHARIRRDDDLGHLQLAREIDRVQWTSPAERDERELAGIEAPLDGHQPDRLDHVGVCDAEHALRSILDREPERIRDT